ncbi:hypothetical protein [Sutterella megalosphaeroides]|uniref:Lipoprotein n=1 Tax=Sutterella megalosphaeroides TaxID=2494234 RepID=A0A2Z6IBQ4_9BURK|nr:hypothetical protein [Sutterella megalosphaeroides]BBF23874.1 hypothetical protein SUTMEG_17650 [Sutterella megalosphaeroides]
MNETTKYGLIFLGGVVVGALGACAISRGKLNIKPLAADLVSGGLELREKALAAVEGVKEDLADVVAEAQVKAQERREAAELREAAAAEAAAPEAAETVEAKPAPAVTPAC